MEIDFSLVASGTLDAITNAARDAAEHPPTSSPDAPEATGIGKDIKGALGGATTGMMAVEAVTAGAVAMGTFIATGSVETAIGMGAVAAGAAGGSELGPIGAAVGAVIGLMVAAGGPATNPPMAFAPSDPVALFKLLVHPLYVDDGVTDPKAIGMMVEVLKDPKAAIAMTTWVANPDWSYFNLWLADFLENPLNPGRLRAAAYLRAHPEDTSDLAIHVTHSPLRHFASTVARVKYASTVAATGAHQAGDFSSGYGQDDLAYGGLITAHPEQAGMDLKTYTEVAVVIAADAKGPPPPGASKIIGFPLLILPKKGSVMHEAIELVKEKAEEAVEVVYKDGKVTKVGKGIGIAAGILVVLKVIAGRRA